MAEMTINFKNNWQLNDTSEKIVYVKTLKTAGQFVDRDIEVAVTAKEGKVSIANQTITTTPTIKYVSDSDKYTVTVSDNRAILPQVTEGWVSSGMGAIVYVNGSLNLEATKINGGLVIDDSQASGYSVYRTTATKGYNESNLNSDISVYQGDYS